MSGSARMMRRLAWGIAVVVVVVAGWLMLPVGRAPISSVVPVWPQPASPGRSLEIALPFGDEDLLASELAQWNPEVSVREEADDG